MRDKWDCAVDKWNNTKIGIYPEDSVSIPVWRNYFSNNKFVQFRSTLHADRMIGF